MIRVPYVEAKEIATMALDKAFNCHFISAATESTDPDFVMLDETHYNRAKHLYEARMKHEAGLAGDNDEWMQHCRKMYC